MTASELLTRTRDYLMEHGWFQGGIQNWKGEVCIVGALDVHGVDWREGMETAWDILEREVLNVSALADWNDEDGRTFNEVMDALDRAIVLAKEHEA